MSIAKSNSKRVEPPPTQEWRVKLDAAKARRKRALRKLIVAVVLLVVGAAVYWVAQLPGTPEVTPPPPIAQNETDAIVAALKPKRERPVIAIVGINDGTETTDYLMPYGILKRADVAEVLLLATKPGRVSLYPALSVEAQSTVAEFDLKYADGADYVIVPAMARDDDAAVLRWLQEQSKKGAIIVGVCVGATVVANAGLLDGKRATTHWHSLKGMLEKHPSIQYVKDRRFVVDDGVMTTTGISASMPMSLTLIEAIAGREKALAVAGEMGLTHWDASHASEKFAVTRPFALTVVGNRAMFWDRQELGLEIKPGVDEVSLALVADALSRTYRSQAVTFAGSAGAIESKNGLRIVPDTVRSGWKVETTVGPIWERPPPLALQDALADVSARYGTKTRDVVAMQLELSN